MHKTFIILCLHDRYPSLLAVSAEAIPQYILLSSYLYLWKCTVFSETIFFFLATLQGIQDFISPTRDQTCAPCSKSVEFYPLDSREVPSVTIFINCLFLLIKSINLWCSFGLYKVLTYFFGGRSFKSIELLVHFLRMAQHIIVFIYHNLLLYYWCIFTLFSVFLILLCHCK